MSQKKRTHAHRSEIYNTPEDEQLEPEKNDCFADDFSSSRGASSGSMLIFQGFMFQKEIHQEIYYVHLPWFSAHPKILLQPIGHHLVGET